MSTRALVVEDRGSFGPALARQLERCGVAARWVPHVLALDADAATLSAADLLFVDALDLDRQQGDPTQSRLASLDVLERVAATTSDDRPRVIVYSTVMSRPEVNIPLRQAGVDAEFYDVDQLAMSVETLVSGREVAQVAPPDDADWRALHPDLPIGAPIAAAHQRIRQHARAWEQIWDPAARFDKAAQVWVSRNVLPLLGLSSSAGYRVAVESIQKIAGLPYRLAG